LTDEQVRSLPLKRKAYLQGDKLPQGLFVRVYPTGIRSFVTVARKPNGKQVWSTIGSVSKTTSYGDLELFPKQSNYAN
jgi:hypothetical protein